MGARSQPISQDVKNLFIMSTIIHSYIIGIVAGKISEESISAGFKHAAILVIIAILAAKLMPSLISFGKVMP
jgi:flagellar protein FlaJ